MGQNDSKPSRPPPSRSGQSAYFTQLGPRQRGSSAAASSTRQHRGDQPSSRAPARDERVRSSSRAPYSDERGRSSSRGLSRDERGRSTSRAPERGTSSRSHFNREYGQRMPRGTSSLRSRYSNPNNYEVEDDGLRRRTTSEQDRRNLVCMPFPFLQHFDSLAFYHLLRDSEA